MLKPEVIRTHHRHGPFSGWRRAFEVLSCIFRPNGRRSLSLGDTSWCTFDDHDYYSIAFIATKKTKTCFLNKRSWEIRSYLFASFKACRPQHCSIKPLLAKFALLFLRQEIRSRFGSKCFFDAGKPEEIVKEQKFKAPYREAWLLWSHFWLGGFVGTLNVPHHFCTCFYNMFSWIGCAVLRVSGFYITLLSQFFFPVLPRIRFDIAICLYSLMIRNAYVCWGPAVIARQWLSATTFSLIIDHWEIKIGSNTLLSFHVWFQWGVDWSCCHWLYLSRFASHIHKFGNVLIKFVTLLRTQMVLPIFL